jgi:hypothetical protein
MDLQHAVLEYMTCSASDAYTKVCGLILAFSVEERLSQLDGAITEGIMPVLKDGAVLYNRFDRGKQLRASLIKDGHVSKLH